MAIKIDKSKLRIHCNTAPNVETTYYPGTNYKMYVIRCPVCGQRTAAIRRIDDAIYEWNNPVLAKIN